MAPLMGIYTSCDWDVEVLHLILVSRRHGLYT